MSDFNKDCKNHCKIESKRLNKMAVQMLETAKPSINLSANKIISPFITKRNNPNVKIVAGNVNKTKMGFTNRFKTANTNATIIAVI